MLADQALIHLPAGVHSVLMSLVPMAAFPIALALGLERFSPRRLLGLLTGLGGVLLLVLPDASLPESTQLIWVSMSAERMRTEAPSKSRRVMMLTTPAMASEPYSEDAPSSSTSMRSTMWPLRPRIPRWRSTFWPMTAECPPTVRSR